METTKLRKRLKKKLIDADLDTQGSLKRLAEKMQVNYTALSMALTGYRSGKSSVALLLKLKKLVAKI